MFQKSVINKYLANIDQAQIETAYQAFKSNYSPTKIEHIKRMKEEEYQDGFLRDLFVEALGYTLKPDENFNLVREFKNQTDGKKADGAILKKGNAIAVIELKSTRTKELKSITEQAFNYKNNQPECKYVITSNFQKLRFYIDHSNEYIEFNLFKLPKAEFEVLYLVLSKESIFADTPVKLKKETIHQEENISKQFYKDYSRFKNKLFEDLVKNNPEHDKLTLFKKSQKLIDRFLFILFAEDRGLLPPNLINSIIQRYKILEEQDFKQPLYDIYKQFFGYLNTGHKSKKTNENIPAYNGGLFYPDETLDRIIIDDETLITDLQKLSSYDFNTEVDVNIIGHIFEHSLTEIEEITAELEGITTNKAKSKRKKDGVFYTPKYITQYIVENTIGRLCTEKRTELGLANIEIDEKCYLKSGKLSKKGKTLYSKIENYKSWLLSLKIIDPACGSGAFLNQALNFLIEEHQFIIDLETDLNKGQISLFNIEKAVLENNLYGVDINEESIEIAKLSLWLRTAHRGRKLSVLNNNIKCGNSLVEDSQIAGEKAFKWSQEFPEIFATGGFDVVIGNPPYGDYFNETEKTYLIKEYPRSFSGTYDIYIFFFTLTLNICKTYGKICFITPNTFISFPQFTALRNLLIEKNKIEQIIDLTKVFEDAIVDTAILLLTKDEKQDERFQGERYKHQLKEIKTSSLPYLASTQLTSSGFILSNSGKFDLNKLIAKYDQQLGDIVKITQGVTTGGNKCFINKKDFYVDKGIPETYLKRVLKGKTINRYEVRYDNNYLMYSTKATDNNAQNLISIALDKFKEKLSNKRETKQGKLPWYCLHWARDEKDFNEPKILIRQTASKIIGVYDDQKYYPIDSLHTLNLKEDVENKNVILKALLGLLNSKLFKYFYSWKLDESGKVYPQVKKVNIEWIPIPMNIRTELVSDQVQKIQNLYVQKGKQKNTFTNYVKNKFELDTLPTSILNWDQLEFSVFIETLNKSTLKPCKMSLSKLQEVAPTI